MTWDPKAVNFLYLLESVLFFMLGYDFTWERMEITNKD